MVQLSRRGNHYAAGGTATPFSVLFCSFYYSLGKGVEEAVVMISKIAEELCQEKRGRVSFLASGTLSVVP